MCRRRLADCSAPISFAGYLPHTGPAPRNPTYSKRSTIFGKGGTLAKIQTANPCGRHVFAKTGPFGSEDRETAKIMLNGQRLGPANRDTVQRAKTAFFAAYVNSVSLPPDSTPRQAVSGKALGEKLPAAEETT